MVNYYEPAEDSEQFLEVLLDECKDMNNSSFCEVGVGSGYVISSIQKKFPNNSFFGTDINKEAVGKTQKEVKGDIRVGNLLEPFSNQQFDYIVFNTPYLPCETGESLDELTLKDRAIYGGKKGYETIVEFLNQLINSLKSDGVAYMLISNHSKPHIVEKHLRKLKFKFEVIHSYKIFFEELLIYKITCGDVIKNVKKHVSDLSYLAKGKHSVVFKGEFKSNECVVKIENKHYIGKECFFLKKLQYKNYVPKLYYYEDNFVVMQYCEGKLPEEIIIDFTDKELIKWFDLVFNVCYDLDLTGIEKEEFTNPHKHILTNDFEIKLIDFERAHFSQNPQNTRQFLQYLLRLKKVLKKRGIEVDEEKVISTGKKLKEKNFKVKADELLQCV